MLLNYNAKEEEITEIETGGVIWKRILHQCVDINRRSEYVIENSIITTVLFVT